MTGEIVQVSVSPGGIPKRAVQWGELSENGIAGDSWRRPFHGGLRQAILLVTMEGIDELVAGGFPLFLGAMGENLTTRGLNRRELRVGQRFRAGEAEIVLTKIRLPCTTLDVYGTGLQAAMYDAQTQSGDSSSSRWGLSGFYAAVVEPGVVRAGDPIVLR